MATTTKKETVRIKLNKKTFEKNPFAATSEAIELLHEQQNEQAAGIHKKLDNLTRAFEALKKREVGSDKMRQHVREQYSDDKTSLGYNLGKTAGNVRAVQHPLVASALIGKGIKDFCDAFKRGWNDKKADFYDMREQLDQENRIQVVDLERPDENLAPENTPPAPATA